MLPIIYQQITGLGFSDCVLKSLVFILILSLFTCQCIFSFHSGNFSLVLSLGITISFLSPGSLLLSSRIELGTLSICVCASQYCGCYFVFLINTPGDSTFPATFSLFRWMNFIMQYLSNDLMYQENKSWLLFFGMSKAIKAALLFDIFLNESLRGNLQLLKEST